jgi:hypothetical protein
MPWEIILRDPNGIISIIDDTIGEASDPKISYDGKRIAWTKEENGDPLNLNPYFWDSKNGVTGISSNPATQYELDLSGDGKTAVWTDFRSAGNRGDVYIATLPNDK